MRPFSRQRHDNREDGGKFHRFTAAAADAATTTRATMAAAPLAPARRHSPRGGLVAG
jgi:hypothetical protein